MVVQFLQPVQYRMVVQFLQPVQYRMVVQFLQPSGGVLVTQAWASFGSGNSQLFTFFYIHAPHNIKMSSEARCSKQHTHQQSIPCINLKLRITYYALGIHFIAVTQSC